MLLISAGWVAAALAAWVMSPFKVLPTPGEVMGAIGTMWSEHNLATELMTSLELNLKALGLMALVGLLLSYATVLPIFRPAVAAITKGRFLSLAGASLILTLIVGGGGALKIPLLLIGMLVFFVTSMASEVERIPAEQFDYARTLRMGEWRVVGEVVVLGTMDKAFEVFRQNAAIGWMMLTMVEGIVRGQGGLGALLLNQQKQFKMAEVFGIQIVIVVVGLCQDYLIGALKRFLLPYSELTVAKR